MNYYLKNLFFKHLNSWDKNSIIKNHEDADEFKYYIDI